MNTARTAITVSCLLAAASCAGCSSSAESSAIDAVVATKAGADLARGRIGFIAGFERGCDAAREQGKPMLVFFTAQWCDYCHAMAEDAFCEDVVVKLSEQFTCVLVDSDQEPEVCRRYRVRGYPTIQFLSPRGTPLNRVTGMQRARQIAAEMHAALQAVARRIDEPRTL